MLAIKGPTPETQNRYVESLNLCASSLTLALSQLGAQDPADPVLTDRMMVEAIRKKNAEIAAATAEGRPVVEAPAARSGSTLPEVLVPDRDLDTGQRVVPGGYVLTDKTYEKLLERATKDPAIPLPEGLKQDILNYYADPDAPISTKKDAKKWAAVQAHLQVLTGMSVKADSNLP
jgi:hypothetical protein